MIERIWVADWELQCCGTAFAVGDEVQWRLSPADEQWLAVLLGAGTEPIAAQYDHHSDEVPESTVKVAGIEAVFCTYEQSGRTLTPVAGSAARADRTSATGWEPESGPVRFVGYLVEVERA